MKMSGPAKTKILPVTYPRITSYQHITSLLSVLDSYPETTDWFYSHYIQLYSCFDDSVKGNFLEGWNIFDNPFLEKIHINRSDVYKNWNSFADFAVNYLNLDYYILINMDHFHIPHHRAYKKAHIRHDTFIYGYDEEKQEFSIADFYHNSKFSFEKISYTLLEMAFRDYHMTNAQVYWGNAFLYKYKYIESTLDIDKIRCSLSEYLTSTNTIKRPDWLDTRAVYGMAYYDDLINSLKNNDYDIRMAYVLKDHKKAMLERLIYLGERNLLSNADTLSHEFVPIKELSETLLSMYVKLLVTKNNSILNRIIAGYSNLAHQEQKLLETVLKCLNL